MSRRLVLAVISQDPILEEAARRMKDRREQLKQKLEFIKKQQVNALKEYENGDEPDLGLIEARLRETGALKNYDKNTHHICVRHESNSIDLHQNGDHGNPIAAILAALEDM